MSSNRTYENPITFEKLHLNARWSDVNFIFKSGDRVVHRIPAHKMVLANSSDVFGAMFFGELKETGDIQVTDASIDAFQAFLQFFYSPCVCLTVDNVAEVMNLGHKYNVDRCVDVCVEFLKNTITDENVCTGLNLAILYERTDLQTFYEQHFVKHAKAIFKTSNFLNCDKAILAHILKMNFQTGTETMVFDACMSWIKTQSQQNVVTRELLQHHLGDLFYKIDFGKMTIEEFAAVVRSNGFVFSVDEYKEIIEMIMFPGSRGQNQDYSLANYNNSGGTTPMLFYAIENHWSRTNCFDRTISYQKFNQQNFNRINRFYWECWYLHRYAIYRTVLRLI